VDLKEFVGSLQQFKTEKSVTTLISKTRNEELKNLLTSQFVADKIGAGYSIRPIFVCNVAANPDAKNYLPHAGFDIDLWDLTRLGPVLRQLSKEWFVDAPMKLRVNGKKLFYEGSKEAPRWVYAAVPARELVRLPGIEDTRVFAQNVRLGLGKTRVNREILESVKDKSEHPKFLTFHNGMTIVTKTLKIRGSRLTLNNYSVCNGCQSLLAFYDNRNKLTDDLEVLVRIVQVGDDRRLPEIIAYRTNNQNPISLRDLSANDAGQVRIKSEFDALYDGDTTYVIKQGEAAKNKALSNEYAGRLLLSLYVKEPWSAHQKYRIFGDRESEIFGYGRTASHVRLAELMMEEIDEKLHLIKFERVRKYALTKFIILYLLGEIMREETQGDSFLREPSPFLTTNKKKNPKQTPLLENISEVVEYVINELNFYLDEHDGENYDYKTEFKSPKAVTSIANEVLRGYRKDRKMERVKPFEVPS
jgi:AIPR protein